MNGGIAMLRDGRIQIGTGVNGPVFLLPSMANRHGLIAGATGTGKTVTLKVLAESFSDLGVPVFLSDIKSDLSGMVRAGVRSEALDRRLSSCGIDPETFEYHAFPAAFWDVYGKNGQPIQATVEAMGPQLLARMLALNETQTGVLGILFRYCAEYGYPLNTLEDLKQMLILMGENAREFTLHYGNVTAASVGAIQRAVAMLEDEGGACFFGTEEFSVLRWLKLDEHDRGFINILSADELFAHPLMYSTFLLWMLTRLYESLPERGDQDKPVAVFFFDEAHLLFDDCSRALMEKVEKVVRLIRSKGVGVYFITQSPADIPMSILGQLGNRVQHALRAYTPLDQKAVRVAAQTFRANPEFDTEDAITKLKTGEALISCLDEDGAPGIVERATVLPPQSLLGALSEADRALAAKGLLPEQPVSGKTETEDSPQPQTDALPPQADPDPAAPDADAAAGISFAPAEAAPVSQEEPVPVLEVPETDESGETSASPAPGTNPAALPVLDLPQEVPTAAEEIQVIPVLSFPVSPTTPEPVKEITGRSSMSQTFKVFDPVTGQYVEQEKPDMTPVAPQPVQAAPAAPVYQPEAPAAPAAPVYQPEAPAAPVYQPAPAVQPVLQQMPVMVLDQATGQYVQQMMWMQQDPATGNWIPAPQTQPVVQPAAPVDPIAQAAQQKAAEAARKEAEKAAEAARREAEKAEKEAARLAKEQEAAERRARNDALREEAAERARKNDSIAGRIKNTAIQTATRQVTSSLTKGITNAISDLFGGKKK